MPNTRRFRHAADPYRSAAIPAETLFQLADLAPRLEEQSTRLARAAYLKGFDAGADYAPGDSLFPECPYAERHSSPNFLRGRNDPGAAWRAGSLDGQRFRKMMTDPAHLSPPLKLREFKLLSPALQQLADAGAK